MHHHLQAVVDWVFSQLKSLTVLDQVRDRKENTIGTQVVRSSVALFTALPTGHGKGKSGLIRSPSLLV